MRTLHRPVARMKKLKGIITFMENTPFVYLTEKKLLYAWENNFSTENS